MATTIRLSLSPHDLNLVLVALGQLPYVQVHELIAHLQTEAGPQLLAAARSEAGGGATNAGDTDPDGRVREWR